MTEISEDIATQAVEYGMVGGLLLGIEITFILMSTWSFLYRLPIALILGITSGYLIKKSQGFLPDGED